MNPSSLMFPVFAIIVLVIGLARGVEDGGFTSLDGIGLGMGGGLGLIVTLISLKLSKSAAHNKTSGAQFTTALFGSMMIKFLGAGLIFGAAFILRDAAGAILFDLNLGLMSYLSIVFLGFAMLPKLVQAPARQAVSAASKGPNDDDLGAEKSAESAQN